MPVAHVRHRPERERRSVGKTTICVNLGIGLAQAGKKVLLIDGDPQGSLTISLGNPQPDKLPFTLSDAMGHILMDEPIHSGEGILHHPEGVDLMLADIQLSGMEVSLVNAMSRETSLTADLDRTRPACCSPQRRGCDGVRIHSCPPRAGQYNRPVTSCQGNLLTQAAGAAKLKTSWLGHGQSQNVFTIISSRVVLTREPL